MGWSYKTEKASWWLFFLLPFIAVVMGIFVPIIHYHPILFCILAAVLFVLGFIVIWKQTGKKDKQE